jgi:hypothetical protein
MIMYYWIRRNGSRVDRCQGKKRSYYRNWLQGNPTFPPFLQCLQSVTKLFFLSHDSWGIGALGPPTPHITFAMSKGSTIVIYKSILFFSFWKTIWKHDLTSTTWWLMSSFKKQKGSLNRLRVYVIRLQRKISTKPLWIHDNWAQP